MALGTPVARGNSGTAVTTTAPVTITAPAAGDILVAFAGARLSTGLPANLTISDDQGGAQVWTPVFSTQPNYDPGANPRLKVQSWWAVSNGSAATITAACSTAQSMGLGVISFSIGAGQTPNVSNQATQNDPNGDNVVTLPSALQGTSSLLLTGHYATGGNNVIAPTPATFVELQDFKTSGSSAPIQTCYKSSPAANSATWSTNNITSISWMFEVYETAGGSSASFSGTGAAALVGQSANTQPASFSGTGAASFVSASVPYVATFFGVGAAALVGASLNAQPMSMSGTGTATFASASQASAPASFSGIGSAAFVGNSGVANVASFSGTGTASFVGRSSTITITPINSGSGSSNVVTTPSFSFAGNGRGRIYGGAYKAGAAVTSTPVITDSLGGTWGIWAQNDGPNTSPRFRGFMATRTGYTPTTPMTVTISHADAGVTAQVWDIAEIKTGRVDGTGFPGIPNPAQPGGTNQYTFATSTTGDPAPSLTLVPQPDSAIDAAHWTAGASALVAPTGSVELVQQSWASAAALMETVWDANTPPQTLTWSSANANSLVLMVNYYNPMPTYAPWSGVGTAAFVSGTPASPVASWSGVGSASFVSGVNTVGGIPIGAVGTGIYAGLKLVWGDEFATEPLPWNLRPNIAGNSGGNETGTWGSGVSPHVGARLYGSTDPTLFFDKSYRGPRHESTTDFGSLTDQWSVSASVLSLTANTRPSGMNSDVPYVFSSGIIDQPDDQGRPRNFSGALSSHPQFHLGADGDWAVEARVRLPTGTVNGLHGGPIWTSAYNWPDYGEVDIGETWTVPNRSQNVGLHVSNTDGGADVVNNLVDSATAGRTYPSRFVQMAVVKSGNSLTYYDDFAVAGTMAAPTGTGIVNPYTDATRVGTRIRGAHRILAQMSVNTSVGGGTYNAAEWPLSLEVDWIRVWTPTGGADNTLPTALTAVNTTPGGLWDATFPSQSSMYGFTPDIEEVYPLWDNEDSPGWVGRSYTSPVRPAGMTINTTTRTVSGTVPTTEGGRMGLMFLGTLAAGGPAKVCYKYWNVAPAEQPGKVFPSGNLAIGQTFARTLNYNDFHSGNLGPHTYSVTKLSGGTDLTIVPSGPDTVIISGTIATVETTVLQIVCTNVLGQSTTITRTFVQATVPFRWDFRNGEYRHGTTNYASWAALVASSNATFTQALMTNGFIYKEDIDGNLTFISAANDPRVSNRGLIYEPATSNLMAASTAGELRVLNSVTVAQDTFTGPSGSMTADRITEVAANASHYISSLTGGVNFTTGLPYTMTAYVKKGSIRRVQLAGTSSAWPSNDCYATIDTLLGYITAQGAAVSSARVRNAHFLGKGWFEVSITATAQATVSGVNGVMVGFTNDDPTAGKQPAYLGSTNNFFYLWNVMLEQKAAPQSYPIANNETTAIAKTKPADLLQVAIPANCNGIHFVFDDGSTQDVTGLTPSSTYNVSTALNRPVIVEMTGIAASGTSGAVSFTGTGTAAFTGVTLKVGPASWTGTGTAAFVGNGAVANPFSMSGLGTASFTGAYRNDKPASFSGTGAAAFVGQGGVTSASPATFFGSGAAAFVGQSDNRGPFTMSGTGTASFVGVRGLSQPASFTGTGAAAFVGRATIPGDAAWTGVGSAAFTGRWTARGAFGFAGVGTATFVAVFTDDIKPKVSNNANFFQDPDTKQSIPIPEPTQEGGSLRATSKALKEAVEILQGQKESRVPPSAVRWEDLVKVGVIAPDKVPKK